MKRAILSTAYFPNIQYISKFVLYDEISIEQMDTYAKQTYRNRCLILAANGPLHLTVPIVKNFRTPVKDILIDYSEEWQKKQSRAILSAYKNTAFYDHYFPELEYFFVKKEKFLIDLNTKILDTLLGSIGISKSYKITDDYIKNPENTIDLRDKIHPKASKNTHDANFEPSEYYQVFSDRHGFIPNLSIIDLLFNEGPLTLSKLKET
ncbi:MAG: WbqC family protein [Bacteroidales bacterium]|nr:WbqC family protein [Bacteroidales bacterium]MDD2386793.1 WbqC family protein [Bacteroidales bacterium]MDD4215928.1 WbqC family protein [Bacteroidales bacterium]MDY0141056.1 WbqC family protein [Bacteroidales bacterium]